MELEVPDLASLAARVRRLEDLEEIRRLFHSYRIFLDGKDFEALSQIFAEDATFVGGHGTHVGRDAIHRMYRSMVGDSVREKEGDDQHLFTDPIIDIDIDGDRATVRLALAYFVKSELGTPLLLKNGRHEDKVIKINGQWRIQEVKAFVDIYK